MIVSSAQSLARLGEQRGEDDPSHQWGQSLETHVFPIVGALPVASIDTGLVMQLLEPIWQAKPETAGRVRGRIENVFDWAKTREYRSGENPARWRGHLQNLLPKKSKIAVIKHPPALRIARSPPL